MGQLLSQLNSCQAEPKTLFIIFVNIFRGLDSNTYKFGDRLTIDYGNHEQLNRIVWSFIDLS